MRPEIESVLRKTVAGFRIARERGVAELIKEASKKAFFSYKAYCYVCDLMVWETRSTSRADNVAVVSDLFGETVSWITSLGIPGIGNPKEIGSMVTERHPMYTLLLDGRIAGYVKIGKGRVYVLDFEQDIIFPERVAFVMDSFIHESHRGKRLFHHLISAVSESLRGKGYIRLMCHIRTDNRRSISAYERNGFRMIGTAAYRRVLWNRNLKLPPSFLAYKQ